MIKQRNIVVCIILSIITCGIYGLYWLCKLNDEMNTAVNEPNPTSGGMVILFTIITCGIYGWFWLYKMGEKVDKLKGETNGSTAIIYLILGIFGLAIVDYCLIQSELNNVANA